MGFRRQPTSCKIHGGRNGTITGFFPNFFGFLINCHFTILPYSCVTDPWGVQCYWDGKKLPYPLSLSMGLHLWPGTSLVTERLSFEEVQALFLFKFISYKMCTSTQLLFPSVMWQNTFNKEHLMFRHIINFMTSWSPLQPEKESAVVRSCNMSYVKHKSLAWRQYLVCRSQIDTYMCAKVCTANWQNNYHSQSCFSWPKDWKICQWFPFHITPLWSCCPMH